MKQSLPQDRVAGWWRQWKHPREFRIAPERLSTDQCEQIDHHLAALDTALADLSAAQQAARAAAGEQNEAAGQRPAEQFDTGRLAEAAVGVWKAQRKLEQQNGAALKSSKQIAKGVRTARQALQEGIELEIQDHDGQPYDPGLALEVLSFEEDASLTREVVLETFEPSVYFRGRLVRMAKVVVGRPPHS